MKSNIKIIKRAVRDLTQGERDVPVQEYPHDKPKVDLPIQIALTIQEGYENAARERAKSC